MTIKEIIEAVKAGEMVFDDHHDYRVRVIDWLNGVAALLKHAEQHEVEQYAEEFDRGIEFLIRYGNATDQEIADLRNKARRKATGSEIKADQFTQGGLVRSY